MKRRIMKIKGCIVAHKRHNIGFYYPSSISFQSDTEAQAKFLNIYRQYKNWKEASEDFEVVPVEITIKPLDN